MMIRVPFIDRIKVLSRDIINGKSFALNRSRSYQAEIRLLSSLRGGEQSPLFGVREIKSGATVAATLVSARAGRLRLVNHRSSWDLESTRSNLG